MTPESDLQFKEEEISDAVFLTVSGVVNCTHSDVFLKTLQQIRENTPKQVILDFSEMQYVDSSGLGVLVGEHLRWTKMGKQFRVCNVQPSVQQVIRVAHLDRVLKIYPNRDEALKG